MKIAGILIAIVAILAGAWYFLMGSTAEPVEEMMTPTTTDSAMDEDLNQQVAEPERVVTYECADDMSFTATYADNDTIATLSLDGGVDVTLSKMAGIDGDAYANEGNEVIFVSAGDVAYVEEAGEMTYQDCVEQEGEATQSVVLSGRVTALDLEQMMVDGPGIIEIAGEDGEDYTVAVPSMGILLCEAKDNIMSLNDISMGDTLEVSGSVDAEGNVVPCESAEHYVRLAE